jgi:hypothetical protein
MQSTMALLDRALVQKSIGEWTRELGLSGKALYNAQYRGHLSPAIAGVMADKLGEDMQKWIVIAAVESEKDSACRDHLLKKIRNW